MLNSTKEGIVVQFLSEAKDFWVSLNQVYMKLNIFKFVFRLYFRIFIYHSENLYNLINLFL